MAAITGTNVAAGRQLLADGQELRLFTATTTGAADTVDLSAVFENIYHIRAWDTGDGTDAEAYVTDGAYGNGVTITQNKGAIYIQAIGTPIRSTGGST